MGISDSNSRPVFFSFGNSFIVSLVQFNYHEGGTVKGNINFNAQKNCPPMDVIATLVGTENACWNKKVPKRRRPGDKGPTQYKVILLVCDYDAFFISLAILT